MCDFLTILHSNFEREPRCHSAEAQSDGTTHSLQIAIYAQAIGLRTRLIPSSPGSLLFICRGHKVKKKEPPGEHSGRYHAGKNPPSEDELRRTSRTNGQKGAGCTTHAHVG